jgi:hypothetical protein
MTLTRLVFVGLSIVATRMCSRSSIISTSLSLVGFPRGYIEYIKLNAGFSIVRIRCYRHQCGFTLQSLPVDGGLTSREAFMRRVL